MLKKITALLAVIFSVFGMSASRAGEPAEVKDRLVVAPGDIIVQQDKSGWKAIKILVVDPWPDGRSSAHCLMYRAVREKPTLASIGSAEVLVWHAPVDAGSFGHGWERIGNQAPSKEELVGFVEYLKLTDFPRYIAFTGQDSKEVVHIANEHYKRGYALGELGKRTEAISEYSLAIGAFPLFYEAIDNRAFTFMELGKFKEALADFNESLRVNSEGVSAFFSKGECLMKLGDLKAAEAVFLEGQSRFPEQRAMFTDFLERVRRLAKSN